MPLLMLEIIHQEMLKKEKTQRNQNDVEVDRI